MSLGIGIVGAGMISQFCHIANFVEFPECKVVGLAELRPELGASACRRFGIERYFPDHHAMLADPDIHAVVVVTRRHATGPIVLDALRTGRHVLSEKPMAHTTAQATRLVEAAEQSGCHYVVGMMKRHCPGVQKARDLVADLAISGALGPLLLVQAFCYGGDTAAPRHGFDMTGEIRPDGLTLWPIAPDWLRPGLHQPYADFLNVHIHMLNLLRFVLDRSMQVRFADLHQPNGRAIVFDAEGVLVTYGLVESQRVPWSEGLDLIFERGKLRLRLPPPMLRDVPATVEIETSHGLECIQVERDWSFRRQARAFVDDIIADNPPLASGRDALADMALAEEIWRSSMKEGA
ncbi:MAG: Gfo/Idh/MocA family oxidoreductase [Magnetococcales bacterium]|nr:Gfo/Idh/MocA family oxidoreductase [Magnetococcales bacterium]